MDNSKLREAILEAEAEAARYLRLAEDLKVALRRATNGAEHPQLVKPRLNLQPKEPKSTLRTAIDILGEHRKPMHIKDLMELVTARRGQPTPRASIESVLVRAIKDGKFGLKRTSPGTFEVSK
jgi:hypothetical protein